MKARVRRSPHLVAYWWRGSLVLRNYATRDAAKVTPLILRLLSLCETWTTVARLQQGLQLDHPDRLPLLIEHLVALSFLEQSDRPPDARVEAMRKLDRWNPEAGFFHTATKDVKFTPSARAERLLRTQSKTWPMPPSVKRYRGASLVRLPRPGQDGAFPAVLTARRTWRRYSRAPLKLGEISTILGLSAGVQHWIDLDRRRALPLKTFPSGGARHPIECYLVARDVEGVRPGLYHYASDLHALERIGRPPSRQRLRQYVPYSGYFAAAPAMVFFTAVFQRQTWRYSYSRAYRAALIEAGHVCQNFCLTATWLGLAPFSVMGLADSVIEADLGIDGISESVLYCAGVGRPPRGTSWAPLARGTLKTRPNLRIQRG